MQPTAPSTASHATITSRRRASVWMVVASLCLLLACAVLPTVSAASNPGPYGDVAVVEAPAGYSPSWTANQAFPDTGFCLSTAEGRVLTNWSDPLYAKRIVVATEGGPGMSLIWAWIVKLLLQETVGYQVYWYDAGNSADTFYTRLMLDPVERRSDLEIQSYLQPSLPTKDYQLHVSGDGTIASRGSHSQTNQGGLHITRSSMFNHPEYAMESWRAWTMGSNARNEPPLYPSDPTMLNLFITDSWAMWDSLRAYDPWGAGAIDLIRDNPYNPFSEFVCKPIMIGRDGSAFETGCTDENFPSIYLPPQCYPNPRTQCALIFSSTPVWMGSYQQGQVQSLNLSLGVAFMNVQAFGMDPFVQNTAQKHLIQYADPTGAAVNTNCLFGGVSMPCWHRVSLPIYSSLCADRYNGNYTGLYDCDFPLWQQVKYARADLAIEAPRADDLLKKLDFGPADTFWFFQKLALQPYWPQDHKTIACDWMKVPANRAKWLSWISPPAACTEKDTSFTVSDCDLSTATRTIVYSWNLPRACVGGRALPEPEEVSCGFVTASFTDHLATIIVAAVLLAVFATFLALKTAEQMSVDRVAKAQAAVALERSASRGQSSTASSVKLSKEQPSSLSTFRRTAPMFSLMNRGFYPMHGAWMLLVAVVLVQTGEVSAAQCWSKYALLFFGVFVIVQLLLTTALNLQASLNRSLQQSSLRVLVRGLVVADVIVVATILIAALTSGGHDIVSAQRVVSPGGGAINVATCAPPPIWLSALHLAMVCFCALYAMAVIGQVMARVHLSTLFGAKTYASVAKSKAARKAGAITRPQMINANSLAFAFAVWVATAVLLLLPLYTSNDPDNALLLRTDIVVLVCSSVCWLALFGPSIMHVLRLRGQKTTHASMSSGLASYPSAATAHSVVSISNEAALVDEEKEHERDSISSLSLARMLRDPVLLLHFRRYAESSFDSEPVHFLLSCQQFYKSLSQSTLNLMQVVSGLEAICDEYVADGAVRQVNIGSSLRMSTLAAVQDLRLSSVAQAKNRLKPASAEIKAQARQCLHEVVTEVYALVQVNSFPRFLNSAAIRRSQHLVRWAEGFDELDEEEQTAMMLKLREANQLTKQQAEDTQMRSKSGGSDNPVGRKAMEAGILGLDDGEQAKGTPVAGPVAAPGARGPSAAVKNPLLIRTAELMASTEGTGTPPRGSPASPSQNPVWSGHGSTGGTPSRGPMVAGSGAVDTPVRLHGLASHNSSAMTLPPSAFVPGAESADADAVTAAAATSPSEVQRLPGEANV